MILMADDEYDNNNCYFPKGLFNFCQCIAAIRAT